jgi:serine/threonine-protein kinase
VTTTGMIQGTPSYMAPEQAMGEKVDRLADVYALGVVAFECLTGRVPYTGTTPVAILMKHVQEPVPEPTAAEVTAPVTAVLRRCLAKAPGDRWPSAGAFAAALDSASTGATPPGGESTATVEVPGEVGAGTPRDGTFGANGTTGPATRQNLVWVAAGAIGALAVLVVAGALLLPRLWPAGPASRTTDAAPASRPLSTTAPGPALKPTATPTAGPRSTPRPRVFAPAATPVADLIGQGTGDRGADDRGADSSGTGGRTAAAGCARRARAVRPDPRVLRGKARARPVPQDR